jgi:hypothetical protein
MTAALVEAGIGEVSLRVEKVEEGMIEQARWVYEALAVVELHSTSNAGEQLVQVGVDKHCSVVEGHSLDLEAVDRWTEQDIAAVSDSSLTAHSRDQLEVVEAVQVHKKNWGDDAADRMAALVVALGSVLQPSSISALYRGL